MDKNIQDLFKNYDNDMSPRFGHTITLGKLYQIKTNKKKSLRKQKINKKIN